MTIASKQAQERQETLVRILLDNYQDPRVAHASAVWLQLHKPLHKHIHGRSRSSITNDISRAVKRGVLTQLGA